MNPQNPKDGYFQSNGLKLHYLEWPNATGAPLVLVHHVYSQAHTWDHFARRMNETYRVLALDMRGHGDSDWAGEDNYTTEHLASDVAAFVNHLGLSRFILLGGSLGGRGALAYAAQHPEKVAALILEDVGATRPQSIADALAAGMAAGDPEFDTVEEWAEYLGRQNQTAPKEYFLHNARYATKRLPTGKLGLKRDPAIQRDLGPMELWHYVEKVSVPFLMVLGSESIIVDEEQRRRFKELIPHIEIVTIQGAGHIVVLDRAQEFEAAIRDFLHRLDL